ncbi:MAG: hypothetical protein COB56_04350 [Robiginitomaculum sp.]|nr:MAG: hypothetical protein COB56_04350 [Robiginitomaculum sp.]
MRMQNVKFVSLISACCSLVGVWQIVAATDNKSLPDDGTYLEAIVKSFEECSALCKADSDTCRGAQSVQPDVTKPVVICHLNNGFGANPLFPSVPPTPLNANMALADLNDYRRKYGLSPVILNGQLSAASKVHTDDLARHGNMSHIGSDGSLLGERIQRQGYDFSIAAENVAVGQNSWDIVFKAWQDSPSHNETLLRSDVTDFGIALVYEPKTKYQTYWAMALAAPLGKPQIFYRDTAVPETTKTH